MNRPGSYPGGPVLGHAPSPGQGDLHNPTSWLSAGQQALPQGIEIVGEHGKNQEVRVALDEHEAASAQKAVFLGQLQNVEHLTLDKHDGLPIIRDEGQLLPPFLSNLQPSTLTAIKRLSLISSFTLTQEAVDVIARMEHLQEIELSTCDTESSKSPDIGALAACSNLRSVSLHDVMYAQTALCGLTSVSSLRELRLREIPDFTLCDWFSALTQLTMLEITDCRDVRNVQLLNSLTGLQKLVACGIDGLSSMLATLTQLTWLEMKYLGATDLKRILEAELKLQAFVVDQVSSGVVDEGLALPESLTRLQINKQLTDGDWRSRSDWVFLDHLFTAAPMRNLKSIKLHAALEFPRNYENRVFWQEAASRGTVVSVHAIQLDAVQLQINYTHILDELGSFTQLLAQLPVIECNILFLENFEELQAQFLSTVRQHLVGFTLLTMINCDFTGADVGQLTQMLKPPVKTVDLDGCPGARQVVRQIPIPDEISVVCSRNLPPPYPWMLDD